MVDKGRFCFVWEVLTGVLSDFLLACYLSMCFWDILFSAYLSRSKLHR